MSRQLPNKNYTNKVRKKESTSYIISHYLVPYRTAPCLLHLGPAGPCISFSKIFFPIEKFSQFNTLHKRRSAPCLVHLAPGAPCLSACRALFPNANLPQSGILHMRRMAPCLTHLRPGPPYWSARNTCFPCECRPQILQELRTGSGTDSLVRIPRGVSGA